MKEHSDYKSCLFFGSKGFWSISDIVSSIAVDSNNSNDTNNNNNNNNNILIEIITIIDEAKAMMEYGKTLYRVYRD